MSNSQYPDLIEALPEGKYRRTGDIRYAALAIGEAPDPPPWAIEACHRFADQHHQGMTPFDRRPFGKYASDSEILHRTADFYIRGSSLRASVVQALGGTQDATGTDIQRIERIWKRAPQHTIDDPKTGKCRVSNRWTREAKTRIFKK